jgi:hypothetical protein
MDAGRVVQLPAYVDEPISPELALVDPVLAERARRLLPEPQDSLRPRAPVALAPLPPLAPRPRRRWPRTVALAGLVFAVGAVAGGFLRERHAPRRGVILEVKGDAQAPTKPSGRKGVKSRSSARAAPVHHVWASNVLGVAAQVAGSGVKLVWHPPADSGRVVVLRARGDHSTVVFRGRAVSFRDVSPRACTAYRYTIVNYDKRGHRSTGVPTSVVTRGCT